MSTLVHHDQCRYQTFQKCECQKLFFFFFLRKSIVVFSSWNQSFVLFILKYWKTRFKVCLQHLYVFLYSTVDSRVWAVAYIQQKDYSVCIFLAMNDDLEELCFSGAHWHLIRNVLVLVLCFVFFVIIVSYNWSEDCQCRPSIAAHDL